MPSTLACPDGAGSINNPANNIDPGLKPYVPVTPCIGDWQISGQTDLCAQNETQVQTAYAAENININGAPLRIFKLLGVHEQGDGSILSRGTIMGSPSAPGYPLSGINSGSGSWRSLQSGTFVTGSAWVGVDFGVVLEGGESEYAPPKPNWQKIGAVAITQGNTAFNFARQARVDATDGTTSVGATSFSGVGSGALTATSVGPSAVSGTVTTTALTSTTFSVSFKPVVGAVQSLGVATVDTPFESIIVNFTITSGATPYAVGDVFFTTIDYVWKRVGVFNLVQSATAVTMNLQSQILAKAIRIVPSLFTGTSNWEIDALDVFDSPPPDINNVQDLFFQENRDRDYSKVPLDIKAHYSINDSITDLSMFGLNMLDQYSFTVSYPVMVGLLGRPLVTGDVVEVTPELMYDQNLKPIRKFLEVVDTGWASVGFTSGWVPTLYRFSAQQLLPSQETRDIFGTPDTQKYLTADSILGGGVGAQIDVSGLTSMEELMKEAAKAVPERGSDDGRTLDSVPIRTPAPPVNPKGNPTALTALPKPNIYIEDGLPKTGEPYQEGYALPDTATAVDGAFFRLYYPESTKLAPRLYRFSIVKNRWIYLETDRRIEYASAKPSISKILSSPTRQGLGKKV